MDAVPVDLANLSVGNYLTAALVVITAWYAWLTRKTVKAMQDQNERLMRPYVSVRLTRDRTNIILVVENTGRTPAEGLQLELSHEFYCLGASDFALSDETLFAEGVGTFSPGTEVEYVLADTGQLESDADFEQMPRQFTVTARYSYGATEEEKEFKVNLQQFAKNILVYRGARRELKELREAVEEVSKLTQG